MSFEKVKSKVKRVNIHFLSLLGLKYKGENEVFKKRLQNVYNLVDFFVYKAEAQSSAKPP